MASPNKSPVKLDVQASPTVKKNLHPLRQHWRWIAFAAVILAGVAAVAVVISNKMKHANNDSQQQTQEVSENSHEQLTPITNSYSNWGFPVCTYKASPECMDPNGKMALITVSLNDKVCAIVHHPSGRQEFLHSFEVWEPGLFSRLDVYRGILDDEYDEYSCPYPSPSTQPMGTIYLEEGCFALLEDEIPPNPDDGVEGEYGGEVVNVVHNKTYSYQPIRIHVVGFGEFCNTTASKDVYVCNDYENIMCDQRDNICKCNDMFRCNDEVYNMTWNAEKKQCQGFAGAEHHCDLNPTNGQLHFNCIPPFVCTADGNDSRCQCPLETQKCNGRSVSDCKGCRKAGDPCADSPGVCGIGSCAWCGVKHCCTCLNNQFVNQDGYCELKPQ